MPSKTLVEAVDNLAGIATGTDSTGSALPANFDSYNEVVMAKNAAGDPTLVRKTDGVMTQVANLPVITGATKAYEQTIAYDTSGGFQFATDWSPVVV